MIEVLFVLAVASLLLILTWPARTGGPSRFTVANLRIQILRTALDHFRDDNGFYPAGTNGLQDLVNKPAEATNWHGPYIFPIPNDPWGHEYVYECPGKHAAEGHPYDLFSMGAPGMNRHVGDWSDSVSTR